jgi:hypothetical protein
MLICVQGKNHVNKYQPMLETDFTGPIATDLIFRELYSLNILLEGAPFCSRQRAHDVLWRAAQPDDGAHRAKRSM